MVPGRRAAWGGSEGEVWWGQDVLLAGEDGERFLLYVLHGGRVPRALAAAALLLISYFLLMFARLYIRKKNRLMSETPLSM